MHVLHEIFTEGDEEEYAQHTSQQGAEENLEEVDGDFRILGLEDIEGWEGEDGSRHNHARAGTDRLDDDILAKGVFLAERSREADGDDGDGYGGLKHLAHFQAEVCGGRTEYHTEYQA